MPHDGTSQGTGGSARDQLLGGLFEDLEQQAEGLHLAERDAEVADRSRAEYSQVTLAARLHASVGGVPSLRVQGVGTLEGLLVRVGLDWCLVRTEPAGQEWIVRLAALLGARGLSARAVSEPARSVLARLGLGSALRHVAESGAGVVLEHVDGGRQRGTIVRVGADFVEIAGAREFGTDPWTDEPDRLVLPFAAMAALRMN